MASLKIIDGSLGEGGGQILRIALSLSALYGIPVKINNIRAGRPKPGLAMQHLKGLELVQQICNAKVQGARLGETCIEFRPSDKPYYKREFEANIGTAGCIGLLVQVALPCALFCPEALPVTLILKGGTNVPMGPSIEYLTEVFRPLLRKFGADFDFAVVRRGYFPKGGGEFHLKIKPVFQLKAVELLDPGQPTEISGWAYVAGNVNVRKADEMAAEAESTVIEELKKNNIPIPSINIETYREDPSMAVGNGSGINLVCQTSSDCTFGGCGLGSSSDGKPGVVAAGEILVPILDGSCVDEHAQDQMIILMVLAAGRSRIRIGAEKLTVHTQTAIQIAELMLGDRGLRFNFSEEKSSDGKSTYHILECDGLGLRNHNPASSK